MTDATGVPVRDLADLKSSTTGRKPLNWRLLLVYLVLIVGAFLTVIPFLFTFMSSFKSLEEIRQIPPTLFPEEFTTANYDTVLNDPDLPLLVFYRNSAIVALSNVVLTLFTSSLLGYIFAKFEFRGKRILFYYILSQLMIPFQVTMIPSYLILVQFGLLNNLLGLIIPSGINAFGIFLMRQFMLTIPNELVEAARVDGASEWRIFLQIVMPQVSPALATLGILTFMFNWNAYLWPIIVLTEQRVRTLPIILQWYTTQNAQQTNLSMAAAVLVMMPVLIVFILLQRWIIRGISLTGLKG
jgi:multiple sugar transport system permease protein